MDRGTPHHFASWLKRRPFAHRGLHSAAKGIAENSLSAFEHAIEQGFGIELDVRISLDGVAMVFHDATLERLTGTTGSVIEQPSYQLRKLTLKHSDQHIPTLSEVLEFVDNRVPVLIEVKSDRTHRHSIISGVRHALEGCRSDIGVMSFDPEIPKWFAHHKGPWAPGLVMAQHNRPLSGAFMNSRLAQDWLFRQSKAAFIAVDIKALPNGFVTRKRREGYVVLSWTVRHNEERIKARHYVDNIIFETTE